MTHLLAYALGFITPLVIAFLIMAVNDWRWLRDVTARRHRNDFLRANGIDPNRTQATGRQIANRIRAMRHKP